MPTTTPQLYYNEQNWFQNVQVSAMVLSKIRKENFKSVSFGTDFVHISLQQ